MTIKSLCLGAKYKDNRYFPYGFKKSGFFTNKEVDLLENYGYMLKALDYGLVEPVDWIQDRFLRVCQGRAIASTDVEKVWIKYKLNLKLLRSRKPEAGTTVV